MEKNNQCECYPAVWLEWENQMEPGHHCSYCQEEEYKLRQELEEESERQWKEAAMDTYNTEYCPSRSY